MNSERSLKTFILGVGVDRVNYKQALDAFESLLKSEGLSLIITTNPEMIFAASKDEQMKALIESADLTMPDGIGLVIASKIVGQPFEERVTGIDFTYKALTRLSELGGSVFFLGAKPGIAAKAAENIAAEIPGLKVAGTHDGYFKPEEEEAIVDEINASGANFLCLALGAPKQELFARKYAERLNPRVAIGIGGSLDVWSGTLNRAPQFFIDHGIEWMYRLYQEPRRIGRMMKLPLFLLKVIFSKK